jgi:hypothetical protein
MSSREAPPPRQHPSLLLHFLVVITSQRAIPPQNLGRSGRLCQPFCVMIRTMWYCCLDEQLPTPTSRLLASLATLNIYLTFLTSKSDY